VETLYGEHIERDFPAGPDFEVDIHGISGEIKVRRGADDRVRLKARLDENDGAGISFEQVGTRLSFRPSVASPPIDIDFEVEIPAGCGLGAESIHADIDVRDTEGPIRLHSVHGDINVSHAGGSGIVSVESVDGDLSLSRIQGEITLSSVNGEIQMSEADGVLNVQTTNGGLIVDRSRLQRFHANTQNGELRIETPLVSGEHSFARSTNGEVELIVPADSAFTVQMKTTNGDLSCDLPHEVINGSRRNRQLRVNGGGATVELETANGDVRVRSTGAGNERAHNERDNHVDAPRAPHMPSAPHVPAPHMPHAPTVPPTAAVPPAPVIPPSPMMPQMPSIPGPDVIRDLSPDELSELERESDRVESENTLTILARLENGDLSVDEAMHRLESLR